jgi:ATP-dependent Clp protease ATP-binding subunit ClpX
VLENVLLAIMFEIPDRDDIKECLITRDVILKKSEPIFGLKVDRKIA